MCIICTKEIYKQNLDTLQKLDVSFCSNLTSEKLQEVLIQCKNLKELRCYCCTSLTSLDLRNNINLSLLSCSRCTSLTSLDLRENIKLTILWCRSCISLTSVDLHIELDYKYINCYNSPWISQNEYFSSNLQKLLKIQRWYRRILIIKYMKSKQFIEWIYNPNNIGGKYHKLKLLKEFTYIAYL